MVWAVIELLDGDAEIKSRLQEIDLFYEMCNENSFRVFVFIERQKAANVEKIQPKYLEKIRFPYKIVF